MKAFKVKRVSLRTLWRRSLVILSLLALVFAACGSSSDDNGNGGNGPVVPPAGPTVVAINILRQPSVVSWQGAPPDLTDLIAEITWSNGDVKIETDITKFTTTPGFCDDATYTSGTPFEFGLMVNGHPVISHQPLLIYEVVPAMQIQMTGKATRRDWYSDQRPDYSGMKLEIEYDYYDIQDSYYDARGSGGYAEPTTTTTFDLPRTKKVVTPTAAYPKLYDDGYNAAEASAKKFIRVGIYDCGDGLDRASGSITDGLQTIFLIDNFYEITGIAFEGNADWQDYFDDDLDKFYSGGYARTNLDEWKVIGELKKSKVKFKVYYKGGKEREIDMDEFVGNNMWYQQWANALTGVNLLGTGVMLVTNAPRVDPNIQTPDGTNYMAIGYGDYDDMGADGLEQVWLVTIEYVPVNYQNSTTIAQVEVPIPIFVFDDDLVVERIPGTAKSNVLTEGGNDTFTFTASGAALTAAGQARDLAAAIKMKWQVTAKYSRLGVNKTKSFPVTAQMLSDGEQASHQFGAPNTSIDLDPGTNADWVAINSDEIFRNWELPLRYRDFQINRGDEESVFIDLMKP
jgi:hypothetical protein